MQQRKRKRKGGLIHYPVLILFSLFFVGMFLLDCVTPDRTVSELENTTLTQRPAVTAQILSSAGLNRFFNDYTQYTKDQIPGRDAWISLQSFVETALLQKTQSGGVLLGDHGQMFDRTYGLVSSEERTLPRNVAAVGSLAGRYPGRVYVMVAPAASAIYPERVPAHAPLLEEEGYIRQIQAAAEEAGGVYVPLQDPLAAHKDEYIYYRTDHHWTSLGAYYGFTALGQAMGIDVPALDSYTDRHTVSDSFYGTTWSSSGFSWVKPDSMEVFVNEPEGLKITSYPTGSPEEGQLYDESYLDVKDKYSMFMGGNCPLHEIVTGNEGPSLLIIRDSYTDSLIPFLLDDFSEIHVIDLRYYRMSVSDYIAEHDFDNVLVAYSVSTFATDTNLFLMGR